MEVGAPSRNAANGVACDVSVEVESSARHIGGAAEESHAAVVNAELDGVRAGRDRHVVVDLVNAVAVEAIAAVAFGRAEESGDIHRRNTDFARRQRTVAVRQAR